MKEENKKQSEHNNVLPLIINEKKYEWSHQYITGAKVRKLAHIPEEDELFLAIKKPWEDEQIKDDTSVDLARPGIESFFSRPKHAGKIILIVNGTPKEWDKDQISFIEVIILAYGNYIDKVTMVYTVAFEDGPKKNPEGSMVKGSVVYVKNKMIFHATATDKS